MISKQPFCPKAKAAAKSSHNKDFEGALTFGWFGGAFVSMSVQKLAILADPILTFYKVCIVGLANKVTPNHNTQYTKHNNQPK